MKLHDPATERELMKLAAQGRNGRPIERADRGRSLSDLLGKPFLLLVGGYMMAVLLGALDPRMRTAHWPTLYCSLVLTATALIGSVNLLNPINSRTGYGATLLNLPIPGERLFRWVRSRFLAASAPTLLMLGAVCSIARHGFTAASPWSAAATTLLLAATTFATIILLNEDSLQKLRLRLIWAALTALAVVWILGLFIFRRTLFAEGNTPDWLAEWILHLTWIFPPSWCLPGRFENGGAVLALPWITWGISRWISWPRRIGLLFDQTQDIAPDSGDFPDDEHENDFAGSATLGIGPFQETTDPPCVTLPEPMAMAGGGWVDQWVRRVIGKKDAPLAAALVDLNTSWTKQTHRLMFLFPPGLTLLWAFSKYLPSSGINGAVETTAWICAFGFPAVFLLPISNSVPRATAGWILGNQALPVFTMLPVGVRDLLRISSRISLARCLVACGIGTPIYGALLAAFDGDITPWAACWLVPGVCWFWSTSRPLFLWYRLQTLNHPRRGARVLHVVLTVVLIALAIVWLVSGIAGVICGFALFVGHPTASDRLWLPVWAAAGLLASGLCARAVFEIHRWQLTRRYLDWLSSE